MPGAIAAGIAERGEGSHGVLCSLKLQSTDTLIGSLPSPARGRQCGVLQNEQEMSKNEWGAHAGLSWPGPEPVPGGRGDGQDLTKTNA